MLVRDRRRLGNIAPSEVVEGDITDPSAWDRAVPGVDVVYHVAGSFREAEASDESYR